ncbi:MAG: hypothetical protein DRR08_23935 [Candidatus Parabeggiatoa sp. nov. 2]|nr:MAG: hypothetical protein B6247_13960 [Beggiatoa sp. 4572_84]RKZ55593.1 MAG: hypothetical protein DRR08_23935 [Gammaproteobacteria bacterium]
MATGVQTLVWEARVQTLVTKKAAKVAQLKNDISRSKLKFGDVFSFAQRYESKKWAMLSD